MTKMDFLLALPYRGIFAKIEGEDSKGSYHDHDVTVAVGKILRSLEEKK